MNSDGVYDANPNYGRGWADVISVSNDQATLRTYIYEFIKNYNGQSVDYWYPTSPSNVDFKYTLHGIPYEEVSGNITSATTWKGKVKLTDDTYVDNNSTLTVMPGTQILLAPDTKFKIQPGSKIIAEGTESRPITFTRGARWPLCITGD